VLFFENASGNAELDWLREGLADMVITDLSRSAELSVLSRQQLRTILDGLALERGREGDLAAALEVARRGRAKALVRGTFLRLGDRVRLDVQLLEGASGRLLAAESALAERPEEILTHVDLLALKLLPHLGARPRGEALRQTLRDVRTESLDAYRYYSLGLEKAQSLHTREAIALFEKALELDPGFAIARARIGYALGVTGNEGDLARPHFERALASGSRLSAEDRLVVSAWDAIARLDYARAVEEYRRLVQRFPGEVEHYLRLAKLLVGEQRPAEAIDVLRRGLVVDPDDRYLHNTLSNVYSDAGRHEEAIAEANRTVALDPQEPNALDTLAAAHHWAGHYEEALEVYGRALSLNPEFGVAIIHLGNLHFEMGRYRDALAAFERYGKLASADWERVRSLDSQIWLHLRKGDLRRAEEVLRRYPEGEEWGGGAWRLAVERGDPGLEARLAALETRPSRYTGRGQRPTLRHILVTRGELCLRAGRVEEGIAFLQKALAQRPPRWDIDPMEGALADAYRRLGRLDEAVGEYERLLALNPRMPGALYGLGLVRERQGREADARRLFEAFLEVWKTADEDAPDRLDATKRLAALARAG
ncbi:MAG: tetratricopeptide repeat protein, partial [Acidobacteria bacterium]|nr:tetratricopeptide repeat protein [Acidobacteriota bacterium]